VGSSHSFVARFLAQSSPLGPASWQISSEAHNRRLTWGNVELRGLEPRIRSIKDGKFRFITADALHEYVRTLERHYEEAS